MKKLAFVLLAMVVASTAFAQGDKAPSKTSAQSGKNEITWVTAKSWEQVGKASDKNAKDVKESKGREDDKIFQDSKGRDDKHDKDRHDAKDEGRDDHHGFDDRWDHKKPWHHKQPISHC